MIAYDENQLILIKNLASTESIKVESRLKEHQDLNMRQIHLLTERSKELNSLIDSTDDNLTRLRREA